jgi:GWxTD domain-containing protein
MRIRPTGFMICALAIVVPSIARAEKLDDDDRKFLLQVQPIIGRDEEGTYKKLKDKADRLEFQKIFWARRDPNLKTPLNEFKEKYLKDLAIAGQRYAVLKDPRPGWTNHCGRVFLLLGEPDQIDKDDRWGNKEAGKRMPETWTYRDRPGQKFAGGRLELTFSDECWGTQALDYQLDRLAASKIVQPSLDYRIDKNGHLVKLVDMLPKDSAARALIEQPRQDFPLTAQAAFLKISDGGTGLIGLLRGEAATLASADVGGTKTVSLSIAAKAVAEDGTEAGWIEQAVNAAVGSDGAFLASFKMGLKPGKYTVSVGAVDTKSSKGSLTSVPVDAPDFSKVETAADGSAHPVPSISSLFLLRTVEELTPGAPAEPTNPFAAYTIGTVRLIPYFGATFHASDELSVLYQVYDLAVAPPAAGATEGQANGLVTFVTRKDGKVLKDRTTNKIETAVGGSVIGPISLASYAPGRYQIEIKLLDRVAKPERTLTQQTWFEVVP